MELEKIKELMVSFDFIKNPVSQFIKKYHVSDSFVRKKLKLWNIPHTSTRKQRNILTPRNRLGQFCLSNKVNQTVTTKTTHINSRVKNEITPQMISKNKKFPENPPDIGDEWETINLNESDKKNYRNRK
jgi:hypothetical protein